MKVTVNVTLNQSKIKELEQVQYQALEMTAQAVLTDIKTSGVVPKDVGTLEESAFIDTSQIKEGIAFIVFDTPYARRLYWNPQYNFRTDKNPNARGKWMETYHMGDKRKWVIETYGKFVRMLLKQKGVVT